MFRRSISFECVTSIHVWSDHCLWWFKWDINSSNFPLMTEKERWAGSAPDDWISVLEIRFSSWNMTGLMKIYDARERVHILGTLFLSWWQTLRMNTAKDPGGGPVFFFLRKMKMGSAVGLWIASGAAKWWTALYCFPLCAGDRFCKCKHMSTHTHAHMHMHLFAIHLCFYF